MTTNRTEETELKIAECHLIVLHKIAAVSDMGFDVLLGRVTHLVFIYPLQEKCGHIERLSHFQGKSFSKDCLVTIHQVFELGSFLSHTHALKYVFHIKSVTTLSLFLVIYYLHFSQNEGPYK